MKANLIAVVLSFLSMSFHLYASPTPLGTPATAQEAETATPKINLNTAELKTLIHSFKGIGQKRAEAIVKYRESHDGFKSVEELAEVPGLGQQFINRNLAELKETFSVE
ncbi:helix-hairpin-helix domain-containing protein [Legionella sp. MW5194]|uniref:ComEA family DNA-binding protein n=1 Tax=Legionella sp. MW5194 TaxID=2662448 RepID=UPI00193E4604|nr:helix-hairpin-helix domain-containing protein [Legionella sp. MW5194]QRN03413.1 helix-hairpin-helix domain-containing protein [Legionella sp. MW5194]